MTGFAPRVAWPSDFPEVQTHTTVKVRDAHPAYAAAKSGDREAAVELVEDLLDDGAIEQLHRRLGDRKPVIVPVRALELQGRNVIPDLMAEILASRLGLEVDQQVVQANIVVPTRASGFERLARPAWFFGDIRSGWRYLVVDDHVGLGGTLANIRGHIESNGGKVVLATTVTQSRDSHRLALSPETLRKLREKHGHDLETFWRERFGHGLDQLSEPEAGYLLRTQNVDRIRAQIDASGGQGDPSGVP